LLLLHVSATVRHPQGARLYLLSYMPIWVWLIKFCVVCGCVYVMWRPGAYRSVFAAKYYILSSIDIEIHQAAT
jgi:hypothetical protein